ncbi:MAG: hypothetical protein II473_06590, partial [Clostridia bacterium]|nr:hypothetical protein [Clostridia bacterium]
SHIFFHFSLITSLLSSFIFHPSSFILHLTTKTAFTPSLPSQPPDNVCLMDETALSSAFTRKNPGNHLEKDNE